MTHGQQGQLPWKTGLREYLDAGVGLVQLPCPGLTRVSQLVYTRAFRAFEVYLAVGALYLIMTHTASRLSSFLERRFRVRGRIQ